MAAAGPGRVSEPAAQGLEGAVAAASSSDPGGESDSSSGGSSGGRSRFWRSLRVPGPSGSGRRAPSGRSSVDQLPRAVRNRVQALRNIQDECDKVDALFLKAIHDLERKYAELNRPLYNRRFQIINAEHEPPEAECEWNAEDEVFSSDEEMQEDSGETPALEGEEEDDLEAKPEVKAEENVTPKENSKAKTEDKAQAKDALEARPEVKEDPKEALQAKAEDKGQTKAAEAKARTPGKGAPKRVPEVTPKERALKRARKGKPKREDPEGIPDYWLTVFKNVDKLGPMIQKYDEPILNFLSDVSLKF